MKAFKINLLPVLFAALAATFLLAGCASQTFRAEVSRFHTLDEPRGEKILIEPAEGIDPGLEFETYAAQLGEYLTSYGYVVVEEGTPNLIARLGWAAKPDPNFYAGDGLSVGIGFGGAGRHVGGGIATSVDLSEDDGVYYRHTVTLLMFDANTKDRLYEGSASGYTYGEYWPGMMPRLLGAMFLNWPGESGTTERLKLPDY